MLWITFLNFREMTVEERRRRRFSDAFRIEQVALIESGELSVADVSRLYEVQRKNVRRWLDRFGNKPIPPTIHVTSVKDVDRLKSLEAENKKLKELIADQQLSMLYNEELLKMAREKLGDDFEKK